MGLIREQDSLQSFDITLGYDTSVVRPTDGLIVGTLSDQMRFGDLSPSFNFSIPGEMRVGAFTITRNVNGDLPLFAVAGSWLGTCGETGSFIFPWPHDFNPEFKKSVSITVSDTIRSIVNARVDPTQGPTAEFDTVDMVTDSTATLQIETTQHRLRGSFVQDVIRVTPSEHLKIDTINAPAATELTIDDKRTTAVIKRLVESDSTFVYSITIRRTIIDSMHAVLSVEAALDDSCGCVKPGKQDSIVIKGSGELTSVESQDQNQTVLHEGPGIEAYVSNDVVYLQNLHGQPTVVTIHTLVGLLIGTIQLDPYASAEYPITTWSRGMYIVTATSPKQTTTKKITK